MPAIWRISLILPTSRTEITTVAAKKQSSSLRGVMDFGGFLFSIHAVCRPTNPASLVPPPEPTYHHFNQRGIPTYK
jgi:hypothetical protein